MSKYDKLAKLYSESVLNEAPSSYYDARQDGASDQYDPKFVKSKMNALPAQKENLTVNVLDMLLYGISAAGKQAFENKDYYGNAIKAYASGDFNKVKDAMCSEPWVWLKNFSELENRGDKAIRVSYNGKRYHWPLTY